jgi:hypothetical protein
VALTQAQRKKVARRTTPSSKARLRKRYSKQNAAGGNKPAKAKPKRPDPLYNPAAPLAGNRLRRAAQQLTALEFGSARASLDREAEQATTQGNELTARASDYYKKLAEQEAGVVARQQAIGSELQGTLSRVGAESQQALSAIEQEAAQRAAQDAAVRGPGLSGGPSPVADEIAAARALAARGTQGAQETSALTSSNWANLTNVANVARGMAGGETLTRLQTGLANTQNDIRGRRATLDEQAAAKRAENVLKLRQQGYENIVTAEGLGIDRAKLQADMQNERADRQLARRRITSAERQNRERLRSQEKQTQSRLNVQMRGQDMTAKQRAADRRARERISAARQNKTRLESADAKKVKAGIGNALVLLQQNKPKNPTRWLTNPERGAPGIVAQAAAERYKYGGIRPSTAAELRRLGVRVPKGWLNAFAGPPTPR